MIKEAVDLGKDINESFDADSGSVVEKIVFSNRLVLVLMTLVISAFMAYVVVDKLALSASYEKMMPQNHEYVVNYFEHSDELSGLGSALRVVVTNPNGNIFDAEYIEQLRRINDDLFMVPGVDRAWIKSLWSPAVRWTEVTEEGFRGGPVMPSTYDGSAQELEKLKLGGCRS